MEWLGIATGLVLLAVLGLAAAAYVAPGSVLRAVRGLGRRMSGLARRKVRADDHDVVYVEAGQGEPVVLLHGFGASKEMFLAWARGLSRRHRVIIPDLPGFGESSYRDGERYGYAEQVSRLKAFVEALGLERFHLGGNSMGGAIAGVYAATHPGDVHTLLLMDNGAVEMPIRSDYWDRLEEGDNALIVRSVADVDVLLEYCFHRPPPLGALGKRVFGADGASRVEQNETIFNHIYEDYRVLEERLHQITAPTLVMWGKQDRVLDVSIVEVLERSLARARAVIYDRCGHLPCMEKPAESVRDYLSFLRSPGV